jgi:exosome complex component CSL4
MEVADNLLLAGGTMEPVSWQEMRCPKTGRLERRKCAKPE